jgi:hypothetical protein
MRDRRRMALPVRLRQEARKRLGRWLGEPQWSERQDIRGVLSAPPEGVPAAQVGEALLAQMRAARSGPDAWTRAGRPVDATAIIRQADAIRGGESHVFDHPFRYDRREGFWRSNPLSGVTTPLRHFSSLPLAPGALGGDIKFVWEVNRHHDLVRLAQAYALTGDEGYADDALAHLDQWMHENPTGVGINWISALEVSFRAIAWCWIWELTHASRAWTAPRLSRFLWTLDYSARFVLRYDSVHHAPNTHLTGEALGLLYIGCTFPELAIAQRARTFGINTLTTEVPHQFLADGFHFERATGYHRYHVEFYLHASVIARRHGEQWDRVWYGALTSALDAIQRLRRPDGDWPVFGDEDGGSTLRLWASHPRDQEPLLALGAALFDQPRWIEGLAAGASSLAWWLGLPVPASVPAAAGASRAISLPAAGYFGGVDRHGWYCVVDAGAHVGRLTGHAHTDLGHVEIAHGAQPLVMDPGSAVYAADLKRRAWYRGEHAHAMLTVQGVELAVPRGPFGWRVEAPTPSTRHATTPWGWWTTLSYALPGLTNARHERQVVLVNDIGIIVVDTLIGATDRAVTVAWPLAQQLHPTALDITSASVALGDYRIRWAATATVGATITPSVRSPSYGVELPVSRLELALPLARERELCASWFTRGVSHVRSAISDTEATFAVEGAGTLRIRPGVTPELDHAARAA